MGGPVDILGVGKSAVVLCRVIQCIQSLYKALFGVHMKGPIFVISAVCYKLRDNFTK